QAELDFEHLLSLERRADLRELEGFCSIATEARKAGAAYTSVTLVGLKDFVVRELSAPPAKGKARNIVNKSGREQFLWCLARSSPIRDDVGAKAGAAIGKMSTHQAEANLPTLRVKWRDEEPVELLRRVYLPKPGKNPLEESVLPVDIDEDGLRAIGYVLARS